MTYKITYILLLGAIFLSFGNIKIPIENSDSFELITTETEFVAGESIVLKFSNTGHVKPNLYLSHSYGSTMIKPILESGVLNYQIPEIIITKTGIVSWKLLSNINSKSGKFTINPKQEIKTLESYLGPPSIEAGGTDYTMLVVIPTDSYDNPLPDSTQVNVKHQFLTNQNNGIVYVKNRIAHKNIYSPIKTGRMLISSESVELNSKEYDVNILPAIPTDFSISYQRNHEYADGNQITSFSTSIIKDTYDNIVSDGTYIEFFITNTQNAILKTSGTTINGIATAKMIHPDHEENWSVKAFIEGMAESNTIELSYKPVISDFEITFSESNRTVTIGPLKSFMNQMIPDGLEVSLSVYKNDVKLNTLTKSSFEGYATFKLNINNFPNNIYTIKVKVAGVEKTYSNTKLW